MAFSYLIVCNCLDCACMQLFVVLIDSFVLLFEETFVQVQAHKWRLSGLSLFQRHVSTSGATEFTAQTAQPPSTACTGLFPGQCPEGEQEGSACVPQASHLQGFKL